jgi:hypothetical protein
MCHVSFFSKLPDRWLHSQMFLEITNRSKKIEIGNGNQRTEMIPLQINKTNKEIYTGGLLTSDTQTKNF